MGIFGQRVGRIPSLVINKLLNKMRNRKKKRIEEKNYKRSKKKKKKERKIMSTLSHLLFMYVMFSFSIKKKDQGAGAVGEDWKYIYIYWRT